MASIRIAREFNVDGRVLVLHLRVLWRTTASHFGIFYFVRIDDTKRGIDKDLAWDLEIIQETRDSSLLLEEA